MDSHIFLASPLKRNVMGALSLGWEGKALLRFRTIFFVLIALFPLTLAAGLGRLDVSIGDSFLSRGF